MNQLINSQFFGWSGAPLSSHVLVAPHGIQGTGHNAIPALISAARSLTSKA